MKVGETEYKITFNSFPDSRPIKPLDSRLKLVWKIFLSIPFRIPVMGLIVQGESSGGTFNSFPDSRVEGGPAPSRREPRVFQFLSGFQGSISLRSIRKRDQLSIPFRIPGGSSARAPSPPSLSSLSIPFRIPVRYASRFARIFSLSFNSFPDSSVDHIAVPVLAGDPVETFNSFPDSRASKYPHPHEDHHPSFNSFPDSSRQGEAGERGSYPAWYFQFLSGFQIRTILVEQYDSFTN